MCPQNLFKEMTEDEYKVYKNILEKDKGMIKLGYNRMKEKLKSIRQDYSKAVHGFRYQKWERDNSYAIF